MSSAKKSDSKTKTATHGEKKIGYSHRVTRKTGAKAHMVGYSAFSASKKGRTVDEGYRLQNGLYLKNEPVPPSALKKGLEKARADIENILNEVSSMVTANGSVSELEVSISFNAEGKFMGFGVGGAASIKIKMVPSQSKE
jgi:hypothetical protein